MNMNWAFWVTDKIQDAPRCWGYWKEPEKAILFWSERHLGPAQGFQVLRLRFGFDQSWSTCVSQGKSTKSHVYPCFNSWFHVTVIRICTILCVCLFLFFFIFKNQHIQDSLKNYWISSSWKYSTVHEATVKNPRPWMRELRQRQGALFFFKDGMHGSKCYLEEDRRGFFGSWYHSIKFDPPPGLGLANVSCSHWFGWQTRGLCWYALHHTWNRADWEVDVAAELSDRSVASSIVKKGLGHKFQP